MSQTRRGSLLQNLYGVIRQELIQGLSVSPVAVEQSLLLRLYVFLSTSFAAYICIITNAITHNQQSPTEMYMLMNATCVFTAVQLGLMCWLVFVIAPGVQLLFELVAWVCCHSGTVFCSLIGAVFPVRWWKLLLASLVAVTLGELASNDFHFTEHSFVSLRQKWAFAGGVATAPFLCQLLMSCLTTVISWLCSAAGVTLVILLRLAAICIGVGGTLQAVSVIYCSRSRSRNGNLYFDNQQSHEAVIQHEVCVCCEHMIVITIGGRAY